MRAEEKYRKERWPLSDKTRKLFTPTSLLLSIFLSSAPLLSQQGETFKRLGKAGFTFLKISPSARAAGMGDAFTAIADDATAIFFNPAGLTNIDRLEYSLGITNWIIDSQLMSAAVALPLGRGTVGVSAVSFAPPGFEETTVTEPEGTGRTVHVGDIAVGLAYGLRLTDRLSFGSRIQYVEENIDRDQASSWVVDFSTYYRTGFRNGVIAMAMKNFGPDVKYLAEKFKTPLYFNINLALDVLGSDGAPLHLLGSLESAFATDYRDRYHAGAELWLFNLIALRGGYKFNYDTEDFTAGFGLKMDLEGRKLAVDISYSNFSKYFQPPLRLSLSGSF